MEYRLAEAIDILSRTPSVLDRMLRDLPEAWITTNEGPETFSPFDVVGHLISGEKRDWIARSRMILEKGEFDTFEPFDRFAQNVESRGKTLAELLDTFAALRAENLAALRAQNLTEADLDRRGRHPAFGSVTLRELLATWVVHDLNHVAQAARVLAGNYADAVGPWKEYLPILSRRLEKGS